MDLNQMPFDLARASEQGDSPDLVLAYDARQRRCELSSPERAGTLRIWLRTLTGKDDRDLLNAQVKVSRSGRTKMTPSGDIAALRLQRRVAEIRGLAIGGEEVTKLTSEAYELLPEWVIAAIRKRANEISGVSEDLEELEDSSAGE